jgi:hypothetical protein
MVTIPLRQYVTSHFLDSSKIEPLNYGHVPTSPETAVVCLAWFLVSLSELCALVLVLSEVAALVRRVSGGNESVTVKWFCAVQSRLPVVGTLSLASSLLSPVPALVYSLSRG